MAKSTKATGLPIFNAVIALFLLFAEQFFHNPSYKTDELNFLAVYKKKILCLQNGAMQHTHAQKLSMCVM